MIRAESAINTSQPQPSLLTVTSLLPDHPQTTPVTEHLETEPVATQGSDASVADAIVTQVLRHTRYLLTLKGRPPFRLAGIETLADIPGVGDVRAVLARRFADYGGYDILGMPAGRTG